MSGFANGNPDHEGMGTKYYFRPSIGVPSQRAAGLPENWAGGDRGYAHDESNPIQVFSNTNPTMPICHGFHVNPPVTLHVDSAWRDTAAYPSPGWFRVLLPNPLKGVISIELVQLNVPNVNATAPPGRYFWVAFGLCNGNAPNTFRGNADFRGGTSMFTAGLSNNIGYGSTAEPIVAPYAIGKFNYDPLLSFQSWERGEMRFIYWPKPARETLNYIDLSLVARNGIPYDIGSFDSWSASFEIICKS